VRRLARVVSTIGAGLALVAAASAPASAARWHYETLDGNSTVGGRLNADVGQFSSVVLFGGQPHVFFRDVDHGDLRHAWWNGVQWSFETLDGNANDPSGRIDADVGTDAKSVLYGGQPHVFYYDVDHGDLRHAWWNGVQWSFETLDGNANDPSGRINADVGSDGAVALYGGLPHVWYYDVTNGDLRHAWWNGVKWNFETLDGNSTAGGRVNANVGQYVGATLYGGLPHVWYYDDGATTLRHAWWTGAGWAFEVLDGQGGANGQVNEAVGSDSAVALDGGQPHVFYYDIDGGDLRHAWWTGAQWNFETLDGNSIAGGRVNGDVGQYPVVHLYGGQPHVYYRDSTGADLRHAWWTGADWGYETLDGNRSDSSGRINGDVGMDGALTLYGTGPHVWYYDGTSGDLRHAWYS